VLGEPCHVTTQPHGLLLYLIILLLHQWHKVITLYRQYTAITMLCQKCANVKIEELLSEKGWVHHEGWERLVLSANQGCETCQFFKQVREALGGLSSYRDKPLRCKISSIYSMHLGEAPYSWISTCDIFVTKGTPLSC